MTLKCNMSSCIKPCLLVIIGVITFVMFLYVFVYFYLAIDVYYNHSSDLKLRMAQILNSIV